VMAPGRKKKKGPLKSKGPFVLPAVGTKRGSQHHKKQSKRGVKQKKVWGGGANWLRFDDQGSGGNTGRKCSGNATGEEDSVCNHTLRISGKYSKKGGSIIWTCPKEERGRAQEKKQGARNRAAKYEMTFPSNGTWEKKKADPY